MDFAARPFAKRTRWRASRCAAAVSSSKMLTPHDAHPLRLGAADSDDAAVGATALVLAGAAAVGSTVVFECRRFARIRRDRM